MNGALKKKTTSGEVDDSSQSNTKKFLISKEIVKIWFSSNEFYNSSELMKANTQNVSFPNLSWC